MARTEVSTVIRDIVEAFQNGLKFSKSEGRRHRRRHTEPPNGDDDKNVHSSLTKRPQEIKQAYEQSVMQHGYQFEVGDPTSQITLAKVLVSFNTGLVKLLNQALSKDSKHRHSSTSSLLNLSESAGLETLSALSELNNRLTVSSKIFLPLAASGDLAASRGKAVSRSRDQPTNQPPKRPPPTPQLKNGGWVRSKSDPSVVTVVVSKKHRSEQRRGSTSRTPASPPLKNAALATSPKKQSREATLVDYAPEYSPPVVKPKPKHLQAISKVTLLEERQSSAKELVRHPSMYIVPSDFFNMFPQISEDSDRLPPLMPPKVPLHSRPRTRVFPDDQEEHRRARPISMMTTSTKLGEIPEHLLPDRDLSPEDREQIPMPYVVPTMLNPPKKKAPRTLKFWKKDRSGNETVGSVLV